MKSARLFLGLSLLVATSSFAGSAATTNTNNITASVPPKCTIGAFAIAFGGYDPFSATPLDQTGTVSINCTKGTSGVVSLNLGVNASGVVRRMQDTGAAGNFLRYEIYSDAGRTTLWNAVGAVSLVPTVAINTALSAQAYGCGVTGQLDNGGCAGPHHS